MTRMLLDSLGVLLAPIEPGSAKDEAMLALGEALADPERPGVLRLSLSTEAPQGLDALMGELEGGAVFDDPALDIAVTFTPLD